MAFIPTGAILPRSSFTHADKLCPSKRMSPPTLSPQTFTIEAAKRAQFKGAKKHERLRPRKHRPSDINRKPPSANPDPIRAEGVPPVYEVIKGDAAKLAAAVAQIKPMKDEDLGTAEE